MIKTILSLLKNWKKIAAGAIVIGVMGGTIYFQQKRISNLKDERDRQTENIRSLMEENSSIELSKKELERYLKTSESKFAHELDSVTKANNVKIKDLKKIINAKTKVVEKDTVYLPAKEVEIKNDSLYQLRFSRENKCISASVLALTKDSTTQVMFENFESKNETYFMVYKEPKKWWQIFKKRKFIQKTVNTCGETTIKELVIE